MMDLKSYETFLKDSTDEYAHCVRGREGLHLTFENLLDRAATTFENAASRGLIRAKVYKSTSSKRG